MDVVTFMTKRLLSFADNIVAIDRQEVIDFFESEMPLTVTIMLIS